MAEQISSHSLFETHEAPPTGEVLHLQLEALAAAIVQRKLEVPVILLLESSKPLRGILEAGFTAFASLCAPLMALGSRQALLRALLADPEAIEFLLQAIEKRSAEVRR